MRRKMGSLLLVMIFLLSACGNNHSEPAFWDYQRGLIRRFNFPNPTIHQTYCEMVRARDGDDPH